MQYENAKQNIKCLMWKLLNLAYHVEGRFHQMMLYIELNSGNTRQFLKNNLGISPSSSLNLQSTTKHVQTDWSHLAKKNYNITDFTFSSPLLNLESPICQFQISINAAEKGRIKRQYSFEFFFKKTLFQVKISTLILYKYLRHFQELCDSVHTYQKLLIEICEN